MRLLTALSFAALIGCLSILTIGCGEGADVKVTPVSGDVKPAPAIPPSELTGVAKKAVGPGSSANVGKLGKNPREGTK
jgi:hypothetical protein